MIEVAENIYYYSKMEEHIAGNKSDDDFQDANGENLIN